MAAVAVFAGKWWRDCTMSAGTQLPELRCWAFCNCLQVGCGADELIDLLMRCVLDEGDKIVDCPPTFTM